MAFKVIEAAPTTGTVNDIPLNSFIRLQFGTPVVDDPPGIPVAIDPNFITPALAGNYFQLYLTDNFIKQSVSIATDGVDYSKLYISPISGFAPSSKYTLIVIRSVSNAAGEQLGENYVLEFTTGKTVSSDELITVVDGEIVVRDPGLPVTPEDSELSPSVLPESDETNTPVEVLYELYPTFTLPEHGTVGVKVFSKISIYWNHDITIRYKDGINVKHSDLPFAIDPFADTSLITDISYQNNILHIDILPGQIIDTTNKEYTVLIPPGVVASAVTPSVINERQLIKFAGPLSPVFSTPDMVKARLQE